MITPGVLPCRERRDDRRVAVERGADVHGVGGAKIARQPVPVGDLPLREGVGVGVGLAAGARLAVEVLELDRELAHDARFALGDEIRQREPPANERMPVTHGTFL